MSRPFGIETGHAWSKSVLILDAFECEKHIEDRTPIYRDRNLIQ